MPRIIIFCALIFSVALSGHAILPLTTAQEEYFCDGDFDFNYSSGLAFIDNINDLSKYHDDFKDADRETLEEVRQYIDSNDKAIIGYYYILAKSAYGFNHTLANDPALQAVRDVFGPDHHMTLLAEAICSPNLSKRPAMFDSAIDAINDELGENSWEYAYAHILKAAALVSLKNAPAAISCIEKAIELNYDNDRRNWWTQLHAQAIKAVACMHIKNYAEMKSTIGVIARHISGLYEARAQQTGVLPYLYLSELYLNTNDTTNAIAVGDELLEWLENDGLDDSESAAIAKHNYASALYAAGNYRRAYDMMVELQNEYKRLNMDRTPRAANLNKMIKAAKSKI